MFMNCKKCGCELAPEQVFCPMCGEKVITEDETQGTAPSAGFAQSIKNDIGNSESISMLKTKVNSIDKVKKKKIGIALIVAVVLIVVISFVTNFHTCERCGKHFLGKEYRIVGVFNDYKSCRDCYWEYYY